MANDQWHEDRRKGIGGSDVAAILGLSPWKSAMDVWLEKLGLIDSEITDERQRFLLELGHDLEPVIASCYTRETGRSVIPVDAKVHAKYPVLRGNPDRFVVGEPRGVELKSETQFSDKFGEPGTDEVPAHYLLQCAHYMAVCDLPVWDIALLKGGATFSVYTIHRDEELERDLVEQCLAWWDRHIVGKEPPDIDGSGAWKAYLGRKFPRDILPVREADTEVITLVRSLSRAEAIVDKYTGVEFELQNRIKFLIGEHEGIEGPFGKITWKKSKDSARVDWECAFRFLASGTEVSEKQVEAILKAHTDMVTGPRKFLFHEKEGWDNDGERTAIDQGTGFSDTPFALQAGDRESPAEAFERRPHGTDRADELPPRS